MVSRGYIETRSKRVFIGRFAIVTLIIVLIRLKTRNVLNPHENINDLSKISMTKNIIQKPYYHSRNEHFWSSWSLPTSSFWVNLGLSSSNTANQLTNSISGSNSLNWESPTRPLLGKGITLHDRLKSWRNAPLPEPASWVQFNLQTCRDEIIRKNSNSDLLKRAHLMWAKLNSTHIRDKREELIGYLEEADRRGAFSPKNWGVGRGIVFTAGNVDTFSRVLLTVRMLREHLKCNLPVEIFSFPGEEADSKTKESLEALNAKLRIIGWAQKDPNRNKNFHIKASALVTCSFREPLYLDSDNLPAVMEPGTIESLWETKGYKKLGALFWPDYWKTHSDSPIWLLIGTQCRDEWEQEAGQLLIDKSQHLDALLLSEAMLKDWKYWFQLSDGDKDIFRFAMLALRKRWALPGRYLGAAGLSWNTLTGYCGHTMLQHDPEGRPLFIHMNLLKLIGSGISQGSTFKRTRTVDVQLLSNESASDYGVEADMLANADETGKAIIEAPGPVRRRAAFERGLKAFFHGGNISPLCVDIEWQNPGLEPIDGLVESENPLKIVQWDDDPRLKAFEDRYYNMGGQTSAVGF
ncbi:mannosyltransferase putative-domain-containing protein [Phakopsora pachyrhizi]|nr:mannosyltransferase putative-domain-containing protein [Phakopsora pachyrhizi]